MTKPNCGRCVHYSASYMGAECDWCAKLDLAIVSRAAAQTCESYQTSVDRIAQIESQESVSDGDQHELDCLYAEVLEGGQRAIPESVAYLSRPSDLSLSFSEIAEALKRIGEALEGINESLAPCQAVARRHPGDPIVF